MANSSGYDIIFRASDGTTGLDHELENYNGIVGTLLAWVRIPTLSYSADTSIYIYYGNEEITSSTENKTGVWDPNFKGVWHMPNGTTLTAQDSTSNVHHGTITSTSATTGQIDGGASFNGSSSVIDIGDQADFDFGTSNFTVGFWVKGGGPDVGQVILTKDAWAGTGNGIYLYHRSNNKYAYYNGTTVAEISSNDGDWQHIVAVRSGTGTNQLTLYKNGSSVGTTTESRTLNNSTNLRFGQTSDGYPFSGIMDEVRISNTDRSACWIGTEYNSQYSPGTFYKSIGSEESNPPTLITLASFSARTDSGRVTVEWTTKSEIDNLGFNLYRSVNGGAEVKLNPDLIRGLISSVSGEQYTYSDASAPAGTPVCYTLEDIDLKGTKTSHGPACVYWPAPQAQDATQVTTGTKVEVEDTTGTAGGAYSLDPRHSTLQQGSSLDTRHSIAEHPVRTLDTHPAVTRSRVTAVTVSSLTARTDGKSVLISWKTGHEINNLGFHVYREESGQRLRLTREPLAGGALTVGNTHVDAGHSYSFVDTGSRGTVLRGGY